jgi:hypothetical protein
MAKPTKKNLAKAKAFIRKHEGIVLWREGLICPALAEQFQAVENAARKARMKRAKNRVTR